MLVVIPLGFLLASADAGARMYFPRETDQIFFGPSDDLVSGPSQTVVRGNVDKARPPSSSVLDENSIASESPDISPPPSSPCPEGLDWCDEPQHYPGQKIVSVAAKQEDYMKILFPVKDIFSRGDFVEVNNITDLETDSYENVCGMQADYIMPRAAKNKEGQFRFIVNSPEGADEYIQLVKVVRCQHAGHECGGGQLFTSQTTMCKQEFLDHKLVALSESGEELVIDTFLFPSCCTCNVHVGLEFK